MIKFNKRRVWTVLIAYAHLFHHLPIVVGFQNRFEQPRKTYHATTAALCYKSPVWTKSVTYLTAIYALQIQILSPSVRLGPELREDDLFLPAASCQPPSSLWRSTGHAFWLSIHCPNGRQLDGYRKGQDLCSLRT